MWPFRKKAEPLALLLRPTMTLRIVGVNRLQQWWMDEENKVGEWRDVDRVRYGTEG